MFVKLPKLLICAAVALALSACGEEEKKAQAKKPAPVKTQELVLNDASRDKIEQIVRDYLMGNPQVIIDVLKNVEAHERKVADERRMKRIMGARDRLLASKFDFVLNPKGDVHVVEFFDYQCGYCKRIFPAVQKLQKEDPDVRFIFKEFPILGPNSQYAAEAAIAAKKQGKYLELHNALMSFKGKLNEKVVLKIAAGVGLDVKKLEIDMRAPEVLEAIKFNLGLARSLGINGTPTFLIGDTLLPGAAPYRQLTKLIADARKECKIC